MQHTADTGLDVRFLAEVARGERVPLPGGGDTTARFRYLADVASTSVVLARLVEGHQDAVAILAEAGREAPRGAALGVWAAAGRNGPLVATPVRNGWHISGVKPYASGASTLTHALVTADAADGPGCS